MKYLISILVILSVLFVGSMSFAIENGDVFPMAKNCLDELDITQYYKKIVSVRSIHGSFINQFQKLYIMVENHKGWPILVISKRNRRPFTKWGSWRVVEITR